MAWALKSHTLFSGATGGGTTSSGIDTTGATVLAIVVGYNSNFPTTVSDSKTNYWFRAGWMRSLGLPNLVMYLSFPSLTSQTGTGHTFTVSSTDTQYISFCVASFTGASPVFTSFIENDQATAANIQAGSITPPINGCLILGGLMTNATYGGTLSIDSSFSISDSTPFQSGINYSSALAYLSQSTAAAVNPKWTWTTSTVCSAINVVVAPAGGGGAYAFAM
jgi:hypothetical protein